MKKNFLKTAVLGIVFAGCLTSCGKGSGHEAFLAAKDGDKVSVETYIQAKFPLNAWGSTNIYAQSKDGGYYVYRYYCDQTTYDSLEVGSKVQIDGIRASWSGEVEFAESKTDTKITLLGGSKWVAKATDVTKYVGTDDLIDYQNCLVKFPNAVVQSYNGTGNAFQYKGGSRGDDIYVQIKVNNTVVECCVESDFTSSDTEVYKDVESLKVGDKITLEGFLNWYNGANPHVYSIKK